MHNLKRECICGYPDLRVRNEFDTILIDLGEGNKSLIEQVGTSEHSVTS